MDVAAAGVGAVDGPDAPSGKETAPPGSLGEKFAAARACRAGPRTVRAAGWPSRVPRVQPPQHLDPIMTGRRRTMGSPDLISHYIDLYSHSLVRSVSYEWKCHSELTPIFPRFFRRQPGRASTS